MTRDVAMGHIMGLNNRLPITRMESVLPNRATATWLRVASNIDLTADGFIRRRRGYSRALAGQWHSLWADELNAYGVRNGDLVHIDHRSLAVTTVVSEVGSGAVSYARLPDGMVYWTNARRIGRLDNGSARELVTPVPNPVPEAFPIAGGLPPGRYQVCFTRLGVDGESASSEPQDVDLAVDGGIGFAGLTADTHIYATGPDGEVFNEIAHGDYLSLGNSGVSCDTFMHAAMPPGQALAHYRGSLLVASGQWLYISEPYRYGLHNARRGFIPFPAQISIVQPCEDGVYVCADKTYWLPGDPLATQPMVVLPYGALPGSAAFSEREQAAYWQSERGAVIAKPGGLVEAPQDDALIFQPAESGFTWLREQHGDTHLITTRFGVTAP
jgi:hypothetical protein